MSSVPLAEPKSAREVTSSSPRTPLRNLPSLSAVLLLAGCSAAPQAPSPLAPAESAAPPPSAPSAAFTAAPSAKPPEPPAEPQPVALPAKTACDLRAASFRRIALHAPGDPEPWGQVFTKPHVAIPANGAGRPVVSGDARTLRFRSETALGAVKPVAAKALSFGGVFAPNGYFELELTRVSDAGLTVSARIKALASKAPLEAVVPCGDLRLDREALATEALHPDTAKATLRAVPEGKEAAIRTRVDGEPVAVLAGVGDRGTLVSVVSQDGAFARIVARLDEGVVFGFVAAAELVARPPRVATGRMGATFGDLGAMAALAPTEPPGEKVRCAADVPLFVEVDGKVHALGAVLAGATLFADGDRGPHTRVHLGADVTPGPRAKLLVPTKSLDGCARGER